MSWFSQKVIVVPWDYSELCAQALEQARKMVEHPNQLKVIHVSPRLMPTEPGVIWGQTNEDSVRKKAKESFLKAINQAEYSGLDFAVRFGDPGNEIVEFAKEIDAGLIVMPSHGYGWIKRLTSPR